MQPILSIKEISKKYGNIQALNNVSFEVPAGSVFGILGPNGSGKTTLQSILLNVLNPNSGSFEWFGKSGSADSRKRIGTLLETPNFYHYLSAVDNLNITQAISGRGDKKDIDAVLEIVKLTARKKNKFSTYSLGMKQRLAIAAALLGNPDIIVLDEPTNGLDPVGIVEIRELIRGLSLRGKTIIMASHLLDEVEKVCTHVAILKTGNLVAAGSVQEVLKNEDMVEIAADDMERLKSIVSKMEGCSIQQKDDTLQLNFPAGTAQLDKINRYCFDNGVTLKLLILKKKSLEAKFFELTNN